MPRQAARPRRIMSLTPLIDVVFILLIFFMLASSFLDWRAIDLRLPAASGGVSEGRKPIVIALAAGGLMTLDGALIPEEELVTRLEPLLARQEQRTVIVQTGEDVVLQRAITVFQRIKASGAGQVMLARQP